MCALSGSGSCKWLFRFSELETNPEDVNDLPSPIYSDADVDASIDEVEGTLIDTNKFLYAVLCACIVVQVWNRLWLLHLLPIPVVYYGLKQLCSKFGIQSCIKERIEVPFRQFYFDRSDLNSGELYALILNPQSNRNVGIKFVHLNCRPAFPFCSKNLL